MKQDIKLLELILPDQLSGKVTLTCKETGDQIKSRKKKRLTKFVKTHGNYITIKLTTSSGERLAFASAFQDSDAMPPTLKTVHEVGIWLLKEPVPNNDPWVTDMQGRMQGEETLLGDFKFENEDKPKIYDGEEMWLAPMTFSEYLYELEGAKNKLRLDDPDEIPEGIYPRASHVKDKDGVWRPLDTSREAMAIAWQFGGKVSVIVSPLARLSVNYTYGRHFTNRITVLVADKPQGKAYTLENGKAEKCPNPPNSRYFSTFQVLVENLEQHKAVVEFISSRLRNCSIIRGHCIATNWGRVRRLKTSHAKENGKLVKRTFADAPLDWSCGDIDELPRPEGMSYDDPMELAEYARAHLPIEVHDAQVYYKLSSSSGLGGTDKIKMHLYWWNKAPINSDELKAWGVCHRATFADEKYVPVLDKALAQTVQIHFTALAELRNGLEDPFPDNRTGMLSGEGPADMLPACRAELDFVAHQTKVRVARIREERGESNTWTEAARSIGGGRNVLGLFNYIVETDLGVSKKGNGRGLYGPVWNLVGVLFKAGTPDEIIVEMVGDAVRDKNKSENWPRDWRGDVEKYSSAFYIKGLIRTANQNAQA